MDKDCEICGYSIYADFHNDNLSEGLKAAAQTYETGGSIIQEKTKNLTQN